MAHPGIHEAAQVVLGERDQKVQTFTPERTQESSDAVNGICLYL